MLNTPTIILGAVAASAGLLTVFKDFRGGPLYDQNATAKGKVVIVTGANSGIGRAVAYDMAKRGAKVFMACRNMKVCEEARRDIVLNTTNKFVYCRPCDLGSLASVRSFVEQFKKEEPELHILVNNAGVMGVPKGVTFDGFETHLGVNHLGHFLLTNLLLDTLKKSAPSRIVVVSASAHKKGKIHKDDITLDKNYNAMEAYNQSKLANILFARELAMVLLDSKVSVAAIDPGFTDTDLTRHLPAMKGISNSILYPLFWPFMKTTHVGAQTIMHAALDSSTARSCGDYYVDMKKCEPSAEAQDYDLSRWLWRLSEKWTKLDEHREHITKSRGG